MNSNWYVPPKKEIQSVANQLQYSLVHGHDKQAKIISRMIANENTNLNLEPYSSKRFS